MAAGVQVAGGLWHACGCMNPVPILPGQPPRCYALVPCAGVGERSGAAGPKQYERLGDRSVIAHTLAALAAVPRLAGTLVVLAPGDTQFERHAGHDPAWVARVGGATRAETVANGLDHLVTLGVQPHDWVLVHDAARCLLQPEWVDRLIDACVDDEVGGLLALPLPDTLKEEAGGRVAGTLDRRGKWLAQTPQMFRLGLLRPALRHAGPHVTDEASAVEALGHAPLLVRGSLENFKITYAPDFELARRLLETRR